MNEQMSLEGQNEQLAVMRFTEPIQFTKYNNSQLTMLTTPAVLDPGARGHACTHIYWYSARRLRIRRGAGGPRNPHIKQTNTQTIHKLHVEKSHVNKRNKESFPITRNIPQDHITFKGKVDKHFEESSEIPIKPVSSGLGVGPRAV
ncbi:hypothetical protein K1T71_006817 [Dendrolimus kikuchii]|uniref:Uncharacterized protein n=1 Tax=Dendrolimus kikuchii TaxID=765133 RepID=A0ACC1D1U9_9NEOP|nr:hypothetical protein K1T71_006817 [Dendrolimus kikuchii]